jgi:hypothetical protein
LPKADFGKGCIRFKKSEDIDLKALEKFVKAAAKSKENFPRATAAT